jgi:hypothetical protein
VSSYISDFLKLVVAALLLLVILMRCIDVNNLIMVRSLASVGRPVCTPVGR